MYHIRTTKTYSSAIAVQVVKYENRKMIVAAHIGSAHNNKELEILKKSAAILTIQEGISIAICQSLFY